MGGHSAYHLLIVASLLAYLWFLVKIAKPRPTVTPVKDSKAWLRTQTALAMLCSILFGILTLSMLGLNANRRVQPSSENAAESLGYFMGLLISVFMIPLLFALSVRWTRSVRGKWKALKKSPVAEAAVGPNQS
jgi:DMSO/TMAO reductase YedYZ heme-binding membrane subunit